MNLISLVRKHVDLLLERGYEFFTSATRASLPLAMVAAVAVAEVNEPTQTFVKAGADRSAAFQNVVAVPQFDAPSNSFFTGVPGIERIIDATGDGAGNLLDLCLDIAVDAAGNAYVPGKFTHNAFKITPAGVISEIIDSSVSGFVWPEYVAVDSAQNVYIGGQSDRVFKVTPGGVVTQVLGPGNGLIGTTSGMTSDAADNVYVAAFSDNRIFKITPAGAISQINVVAPLELDVDSSGNMYTILVSNHSVRRVTPAGVVTTIITATGDGAGHPLTDPRGVAVGPSDDVYVSGYSSGNVFKITPAGVKTQIASGLGTLNRGIVVGSGLTRGSGEYVYVSSEGLDRVYEIGPDGTVSIVISSSGSPAPDSLFGPAGLYIQGSNLYVAGAFSDNAFRLSPPPPPECGNNMAEAGEQCDGTDDALCLGACRPDCTCDLSVACCVVDPEDPYAACSEMSLVQCTTQGGWPLFNTTCEAANCGFGTCLTADGACDAVQTTPGCFDSECCNDVCLTDSSCCSEVWGTSCKDSAAQQGCATTPLGEASLATVGEFTISTATLKGKVDEFVPENNAHSRLFVLTQCYGGDMVAPLVAGTTKTAAISATSPGEVSRYGGYDDDAAANLDSGPSSTSDQLHQIGVLGKAPIEHPTKGGINVSLEPVDPVNGPIKSRHVLVYAGRPGGHLVNPEDTDVNYLNTIRSNFMNEPNTTVTGLGGIGEDPWDSSADLFGLELALEDIGNLMNPDEQFIMFITDHGFLRQSNPCTAAAPGAQKCGQFAFSSSSYQAAIEVPDNVPQGVVFIEQELEPPTVDLLFGVNSYPGISFTRVDENGNGQQDPGDGWRGVTNILEDESLLHASAYLHYAAGMLRGAAPITGPVSLTISLGEIPKGCTMHGDVAVPYCAVDIGDILYVLDAFADGDACTNFPEADLVPCGAPCTEVDVGDILSVLAAFEGTFECP